MSEEIYQITWECISCGQEHSFRYVLSGGADWPNKFELDCENPDCGQSQDVPFRKCTVEPFTFTPSED